MWTINLPAQILIVSIVGQDCYYKKRLLPKKSFFASCSSNNFGRNPLDFTKSRAADKELNTWLLCMEKPRVVRRWCKDAKDSFVVFVTNFTAIPLSWSLHVVETSIKFRRMMT